MPTPRQHPVWDMTTIPDVWGIPIRPDRRPDRAAAAHRPGCRRRKRAAERHRGRKPGSSLSPPPSCSPASLAGRLSAGLPQARRPGQPRGAPSRLAQTRDRLRRLTALTGPPRGRLMLSKRSGIAVHQASAVTPATKSPQSQQVLRTAINERRQAVGRAFFPSPVRQ